MRYKITFIILFLLPTFLHAQLSGPVILDADTANEVDDLFAVSRVLMEKEWDLKAINATHWQTSQWAEPETMELSHRLNSVLAGYFESTVPLKRGGAARMYDWGDMARHSAAAYGIIESVKDLESNQKLTIIALGALTNVASAIIIDPTIADLINVFWLGSTYDESQDMINITDFNCMMDAQALHIVYRSSASLTVMPVSLAAQMTLDYKDLVSKIRGDDGLGDFLCDRWYHHLDYSRHERVIWDLALIGVILNPDSAATQEVMTPKHLGSRTVRYYTVFDPEWIRNDFYRAFRQYSTSE